MTMINGYFYLNGAVMIIAAAMAMTRKNAVHALLYFIISVLCLGIAFYILNAPLAAALEVMVYAGAIMVLFVFVVMLLNIYRPPKRPQAQSFLEGYGIPLVLASLLLFELFGIMSTGDNAFANDKIVTVKDVAFSLFTDYSVFIELGSLILLAGLIGAYHLGKKIGDEK